MRCHNVFSHIGLCVCLSVCNALIFESPDLESYFLVCRYIFGISPSSSYNKARLDKFWCNQDIVYDFRAQLQGTGSRSEVLYE